MNKQNNYLVDENGKPYIENESSPAGGGLDKRCDYNKEALQAFNTIGFDAVEDYLYAEGFDMEEDDFPNMQDWRKGNTRIVYESYIDGMWGYIHTEFIG